MRHFIVPVLACVLLLPATTVQADDSAPPAQESTPLLDLFDQMLRGFMREAEPQMRELERGFEALEPEIQRFLDRMQGLAQYHPPEVLPNGDILIRRRQAEEVPEDAPPGESPSEEPPSEDPFEL